jgi:hypothetical protein
VKNIGGSTTPENIRLTKGYEALHRAALAAGMKIELKPLPPGEPGRVSTDIVITLNKPYSDSPDSMKMGLLPVRFGPRPL